MKHPLINLYSKYHSLKYIFLPVVNSPIFPSLDDIYCTYIAITIVFFQMKLIRLVFLKLATIVVFLYTLLTKIACGKEHRTHECGLCDLGHNKYGPQVGTRY